MIIDGNAIAQEILARTLTRARLLTHTPSFTALVIAPNAATRSYLAIKERHAARAGIQMHVRELPEDISEDALITVMQESVADALILQLPLPAHMDLMRVLDAIPEEKDADVLSPRTRKNSVLMHPIAASIREIFAQHSINPEGKRTVVVGHGWLVGVPVASWLSAVGAEVTVVTRETGNLEEALAEAEIIVSGTGVPGLITPELVGEGVVVIDAGTSELGGSISGDVDPEVQEKARLFTPVPGGVGPIAVAFLMENVVTLAGLRNPENSVH